MTSLAVDPNAGSDHKLELRVVIPTFGTPRQDLPMAARIKHDLKISVHSQAEVLLWDQEIGVWREVSDTNDDGVIISE